MCNCGKKKNTETQSPPPPPPPSGLTGRTQTFAYVPPSGNAMTFGSRLEADAARVRAGRVGRVVPGGAG